MTDFTFLTPPRLVCAAGGLRQLGSIARDFNASRVLIVTDPGIVACGFAEAAKASLISEKIEADIFGRVEADPPYRVVKAAAEQAREMKADLVVGLGGGSSLDTAKVVALLANSAQSIDAMVGTNQATGTRLPLILIPTTAGTGSEMTWVSVLTNDANEKKAIYSTLLLPDVALLDVELTLGMPPRVTAATALDAIVHAVEAFTSRTRKNPMSDCLAEKALGLLGGNLRRVLTDGSDREAREAMLLGSTLAGMAFVNASVASVHALSYPLGSRFHIPHGHANALVMGAVFRFNLPSATEEYAALAPILLPGRPFRSRTEAADAFVTELETLLAESGLETHLNALGVTEADIPSMALEVTQGIARLLANNPRDMSTADVEALYRSVM